MFETKRVKSPLLSYQVIPLKNYVISDQRFSGVFRGYKMATLIKNGLIKK